MCVCERERERERVSLVAQMVKNPLAVQETWVWSLGRGNPLEQGMATHSSTLAWRISWTEEPGGLCPWGCKELDTTEWLTLLAPPPLVAPSFKAISARAGCSFTTTHSSFLWVHVSQHTSDKVMDLLPLPSPISCSSSTACSVRRPLSFRRLCMTTCLSPQLWPELWEGRSCFSLTSGH